VTAGRDHQLPQYVYGQLAHPVEPHTSGQRQERERNDFHRGEHAHLRGRSLQQHGRRQRQRKQRHLGAERTDQDRRPEAPIGAVEQQIVRPQQQPQQAAIGLLRVVGGIHRGGDNDIGGLPVAYPRASRAD